MSEQIKPITNYVTRRRPVSYEALLKDIQKAQADALWELSAGNITDFEKREKVLSFIAKQLRDHNTDIDGMTKEQLVEKIYNDIEQYSVLTEYLLDERVEGIPIAEGSIGSNIRITGVTAPIVDDDVGIAVYIRKLRDKIFTTDEYVGRNFASEAVLHTIHTCVQRGVSTLFLGKVNTGKTTLAKYALDCLPDEMQIITIESGAREMNLVKHDENGIPVNNVVHMLTREHEKEEMNITQEKLVVKALRLNPDVLSVAEMRDTEAYAAIEASNSGHTVVSTAHAGSVKYGHKRIANLARKRHSTDFHTALVDACEAFPLGVFIHTTEDGVRRIMNVTECFVDGNDTIHYNTLWEFRVKTNQKREDGSVEVIGEYAHVNDPSDALVEQMNMYGVTDDELNLMFKGKGGKRK